MFFYTFVDSSKGLIPIENYQKNIGQNQTVRTTRAPVIFSKAKYYNQTRKVMFFSFLFLVLFTVEF